MKGRNLRMAWVCAWAGSSEGGDMIFIDRDCEMTRRTGSTR